MTLTEEWLARIPDEPGWVDIRGVLLEDPLSFGDSTGGVAVRAGGDLLVALGTPSRGALDEAREFASQSAELVAPVEAHPTLELWMGSTGKRALLHTPGPGGLVRPDGLPRAELLGPDKVPGCLPKVLRRELDQVLGRRPVAVVLEDGEPVSFCFPALVTEHFWDVSVETLEGYRRGGRAAAAFLRLEREMSRVGLQPVWGAAEDNLASLALASRLGFEMVGEIRVFEL